MTKKKRKSKPGSNRISLTVFHKIHPMHQIIVVNSSDRDIFLFIKAHVNLAKKEKEEPA